MKITDEHYQIIKNKISVFKDQIPAERAYQILKKDPKIKDLEKRLRWDCFWAAKLDHDFVSELYKYLNDSHIDSALKAIMKEIEFF